MNIQETIKGRVRYDPLGQYIFDEENNMIAEIRSWGRIQYLQDPEAKQDFMGEFIAQAINEKLHEVIRKSTTYSFIKSLSQTVLRLSHPDYGRELWVLMTLSRQHLCVITGKRIEDKEAYIPLWNLDKQALTPKRGRAISIQAMQSIINKHQS